MPVTKFVSKQKGCCLHQKQLYAIIYGSADLNKTFHNVLCTNSDRACSHSVGKNDFVDHTFLGNSTMSCSLGDQLPNTSYNALKSCENVTVRK